MPGKKDHFVRLIPALLLFFVATSCLNQANCFVTSTNLVKINLKKSINSAADTITFNSITVQGTLLKGIAYDTPTTSLNLPVNPETTETTFVLNYSKTVNGAKTNKSSTLTLGYENQILIISEDCGAYRYQRNLDIISTDFIKTKLINTSLLTTVTSNLEIYF